MPANEATGPSWKDYKAKLESALRAIDTARDALDDASKALKQAHDTLREAIETPPGHIPTIGDGHPANE